MPIRLLFVCLGNICRSPAAEGIMKDLVKKAGLEHEIQCDSAGTSNFHVGDPPDARMVMTARQRELHLIHRARQFHAADFEEFDLILAMDRENYYDILRLDPAGKYRDKVRLMCDFCRHHDAKEVPDPYYGGRQGFEKVLDLLTDACEGLLEYLKANYPQLQEQH
ncbi:low molecular weight phosphotyrosine protein [Thermosynechococcus sp. NK55a]|jgi:protein-tyrosine phosphatase|uniref:low molecular weight protein-tyrosine-phosphatase n=1 Tax=Thermosynechococcus sp. NK55a TaxID=1394889 RepID=UPI0003D93EB2|nr:low molecular weight protein-tyrosine-phosphatase [Thermosynechococcus sp. NK55a]AHB88454.1 low molecular weight phosphotyrosine protein [Thermosynechococcus sp. NK55a]RMH65626.1 MAG: low molecular weight phosphotyrosine protein phosphatase [Cyanobacteria bacterium J003]